MAWRLLKTRTLPIGIDLGTAAVKLAQLRRGEDRLELVAAACAEVPEACRNDLRKRLEFAARRLRGLVRSGGFRDRQCVISLPAAMTVVEHVKTAKVPLNELTRVLHWELDGKLPFRPTEAVIRHVVAGETYADRDAQLEVIAIAAARNVINALLEVARRCRLEVVALEVEPCAIVECFGRLFRRADDSERVTLFLDFGEATTQVVISHGSRLVFARNLLVGAREMEQKAASTVGASVEDIRTLRRRLMSAANSSPEADQLYDAMGAALGGLVEEITKCLRYYESVFPSRTIERAVFLGGQALDRRLCQRVAQRLNLPAQIGDPLARIGQAPGAKTCRALDRRHAQPAWAVAVGLSLGGDVPRAA